MAWKGFVEESKMYMDHPDYSERFKEWNAALYNTDGTISEGYEGWTLADRRKAKFDFWRKFPRAWVCFYWLTLCHWVSKHLWRTPRNWVVLKWRRKPSGWGKVHFGMIDLDDLVEWLHRIPGLTKKK